MRTLRLSLFGMLTLALLGGLGGVVLAQQDYSRSGVWVTVVEEQDCWNGDPTEYIEQPSGDYQVRGIPVGCELTFSDTRLSGTMTMDLNEDCFAEGGCVNWGSMDIAGSDGTWSGWYNGSEQPDTTTIFYRVLVGAGGYEGLTLVGHSSGPFGGPYDEVGVIYEGDPPPVLDLDVPPAE
jgi:hypothetical protein